MVTVMKSVAFAPRESVASTRKVTVTFVAGAVKLNVAALVVAEAITEGVGPEAGSPQALWLELLAQQQRARQRHAQHQSAPGQAARARHGHRDLLDQGLVRRARGLVAGEHARQRLDAGVGHAQGFMAVGGHPALQQAGRQQLDLDHVGAGPAGRAVNVAQAPVVLAVERGRFGGKGGLHELTIYPVPCPSQDEPDREHRHAPTG